MGKGEEEEDINLAKLLSDWNSLCLHGGDEAGVIILYPDSNVDILAVRDDGTLAKPP